MTSYRNIAKIKKGKEVDIIIPAAGSGRRMKSYGCKPLIKIDGTSSIIDRQIRIIRKNLNFEKIILITGFESDRLMKNTPDDLLKVENERYENTNVNRSIGMGLRVSESERILIIYGDLVFNEALISNLPPLERSFVLVEDHSNMSEDEVGCIVIDNRLEQMLPDIPNKWCQISFFSGKELEILKKISWDKKRETYFGFETINDIIDQGGIFYAHKISGSKITDIDCSKDLDKVKEIIN